MDTDRPDDRPAEGDETYEPRHAAGLAGASSEDDYADDSADDSAHGDAGATEFGSGIDDVVVTDVEPQPDPPRNSRFVLATLAGVVVVLVGIAVWSLLYAYLERDYVGVSVVFALAIGYVVREVSRRSDLRARILSAVLTAILCVVGSVVAQVANTARVFKASFVDLLRDLLPHTFEIVGDRNALTFVIFAAAVIVAFLSAGPARPKQAKAAAAPAGDDPGPRETD